jgi:AcrR family transcriptional regulator
MSRRVDLPEEERVRQAMAEVIGQAHEANRQPTVTALAALLGLNYTTFWRHFPDIAQEMVDLARTGRVSEDRQPGRVTTMTKDLARLKRDNTQLKHDLEVAKAVIQRLALENAELRKADSSNVVPFNGWRDRRDNPAG